MPQQRSKDKTMVGGFIRKSLKSELKRIARIEGKTITDLAIEFFEEGVAKRGARARKRRK
jgi:hypothetical protein